MEITKEQLKALRIWSGITQAKAAEMVHLKRRDRWLEYESGAKEPDPARIELFLIKLAIKYGIRPGTNREKMLEKLEQKMKNDKVVKTETIFSFQKPAGNQTKNHKHEFKHK